MTLAHIHETLRLFTEGCRPSMHEPEEQGIEGKVIGRGLDNAFTCHDHDPGPSQGINLTLALKRDNGDGDPMILNLNLADLIALARCADPAKVKAIDEED